MMIRYVHLLDAVAGAGVVCRLLPGPGSLVPRLPGPASGGRAGLALGQRLAHANSLAFALTGLLRSAQLATRVCCGASKPRRRSISRPRIHAAVARSGNHLPRCCLGRPRYSRWRDSPQPSGRLGRLERRWVPLLVTQWLGFTAEAHLQPGGVRRCAHRIGSGGARLARRRCYYQAELCRLGEVSLGADRRTLPNGGIMASAGDRYGSQPAAKDRWELRAATSLARLWADQGERREGARPARPGLRLVHRGLRDTADLKDAKALLNTFAK